MHGSDCPPVAKVLTEFVRGSFFDSPFSSLIQEAAKSNVDLDYYFEVDLGSAARIELTCEGSNPRPHDRLVNRIAHFNLISSRTCRENDIIVFD
jgi:hypothetical protein